MPRSPSALRTSRRGGGAYRRPCPAQRTPCHDLADDTLSQTIFAVKPQGEPSKQITLVLQSSAESCEDRRERARAACISFGRPRNTLPWQFARRSKKMPDILVTDFWNNVR
eukprot:gnl/TRDRNA2_/TRDRNA2_176568_c0_seq3.p2 gnl/TRDRNA2_/TRDRNA2_176568_c0~~gnl/TRDRNA2_/TRDRNA2_176568_c0_seq3.p2  ORF type:complete len:111 (-),score=2.89 gnl/TRDRNA2_/TRDRNA2_176568_c0_seq3:6-338(-)